MTSRVVNDEIVTETRMRRPLGVLRSACVHLPHHELILDEAFEEHNDCLCCPRQLAVLMRQRLEEVCECFDNICENPQWRQVGVSPEEVIKFCVFHCAPCFYYAGGRIEASYEPPNKQNRAVAFTSWESHVFVLQLGSPHRGAEGHASGGRRDGHEVVPAALRNLAGVDGPVQTGTFRRGRSDAGQTRDARIRPKPQD